MEDHASSPNNIWGVNCQDLITNPNNGRPEVFMYYGGLSPFCPNNYAEGSKWFVRNFNPGFGFTTDETLTIECKGKVSYK